MKVWLITGVSTGLGRAIADAARAAGDRVVGTLRDEEQRKAFASSTGSVGVILDVTDTAKIQPAVDRIERDIGPIEVLMNNAGHGDEGTLEESTLDDLRRQIRRERVRRGRDDQGRAADDARVLRRHIVNITSMGGIITMPGLLYHRAKFALEGMSEVLARKWRILAFR